MRDARRRGPAGSNQAARSTREIGDAPRCFGAADPGVEYLPRCRRVVEDELAAEIGPADDIAERRVRFELARFAAVQHDAIKGRPCRNRSA